MKSSFHVLTLAAATLLLLTETATAQSLPPLPQPPPVPACFADIQTYCASAAPSGLPQCLQSHQSQLSSGCKSFIAQMAPPTAPQSGGDTNTPLPAAPTATQSK